MSAEDKNELPRGSKEHKSVSAGREAQWSLFALA